MPCLPERIAEMRFTTYTGEEHVFRRCGYYPDLFSDPKGRIVRISEPSRRMINDGTVAITYDSHTVSVKHLVADAWIPSWEDSSPHLECIDGDEKNTAASNLRPSDSKKRGRTRDNYPLRCFKAMDLALHTRNLNIGAAEAGITVEELVYAFVKYMPLVLDKDSPYRFIGMPKSMERIGTPKAIRQLIKSGRSQLTESGDAE